VAGKKTEVEPLSCWEKEQESLCPKIQKKGKILPTILNIAAK
jgi:hypothetical protein